MANNELGTRESFARSTPASDAGVKGRLIEVAVWGWRTVAICMAITVMLIAAVLSTDPRDDEEALLLIAAYSATALILTLLVWVVNYVRSGQKANFLKLMNKIVFGSMPFYAWFVLGVLFCGGLLTTISHNASDSMIRQSHFAQGVGSAFAALLLAAPFWFFAPKGWGHVGHMIGTILMAVFLFVMMPNFLPSNV